MSSGAFLAVDWGTTNRRCYVIDAGEVVATERDGLGILAVPEGGFDREIDSLGARYGEMPVVLAGMVGSNRGWVDAGYVAAPATLAALAAGAVRPRAGVAIVPGVSRLVGERADVMRGEEVQLLGATAAGLAPQDALLCQPGTHCKWAWVRGGVLTDFVTTMTGELFALLKDHALIGRDMTGAVAADAAFRAGVDESARGDLLAALFAVRPAGLLGVRPTADAASFVSGLLIGTDVRAHAGASDEVHILADPQLGHLYRNAIEQVGGRATLLDSHAAFAAGITRIREQLP